MALSFSEGSIGGDIETINLRQLEAFYGKAAPSSVQDEEPVVFKEPGGSNGVAIAPSNTVNKHALLLINPHTSFFFRAEAQMVSDEGLNAYGALTWGQFFIYQGFNDRAGWMHTSSGVDNIDEFAETIVQKDGKPVLQVRRRRAYRADEHHHRAVQDGERHRERRSSPSTARITGRSSAS